MNLPSKNSIQDLGLGLVSGLSALVILGVFLLLLNAIVWNGLPRIDWQFIVESPTNAGRSGGIAPMLVSTILLLLISLSVALPVGIFSAIYLAEYTRPEQILARLLRYTLNMLAAVPSIVMGMFGFAFFVIYLRMGFSILAGSLTLAVMILPLLIRNIEDALKNIPPVYRLNAAALGLSETRTVSRILLPLAGQGIIMAIILSIARAMAETAALLFTSGYVMRMPEPLMDSGRSLSVHLLDLSINVPGGEQSAYASALVLLFLLLLINTGTSLLNKHLIKRSMV